MFGQVFDKAPDLGLCIEKRIAFNSVGEVVWDQAHPVLWITLSAQRKLVQHSHNYVPSKKAHF